MSDNWIYLIPDDAFFIPDASKQELARRRLHEIAPEAGEIKQSVSENVRFQDCGANFERIGCPSCQAEISISWWQRCMDEDFDGDGFRVATYDTPCCGSKITLHDLAYEWPQGMCRFSLDLLNGNLDRLHDRHKRELEEILGCKLRVIYQHL